MSATELDGRTWPPVRCQVTVCEWDTRGVYRGAPPCAGAGMGSRPTACLAAELAALPVEERHRLVVTLARRHGLHAAD